MKATLDKAFGYQENNLALPVLDLAAALYVVAPDGLGYWFGERQ